MGEAIAKLVIGLVIVAAIIYAIILAIIAAVVIAAVLAPPVGAGYWLRSMLKQRYHLGPRKTLKCFLVGLAMAALPWLVLAVSPSSASDWAIATTAWVSITSCLFGVGLYLSLSIYREVFWPYRKTIIAATKESLKLRYQLWRHGLQLNRVNAKVRHVEEREGARLLEIRQLERSVTEIVQSTDPSFLSAERVRWELEYRSYDESALRRELETVQSEMSRTDRSSPYFTTLIVRAGVIRLHAQKRVVEACAGASYEADAREQEALRSMAGDLRQRVTVHQQQAGAAYSTLRQLRRQRVFVQ